jgi:phenylpyruvate tautomerase PptA (4-oxalocrotonate tautomerase family)
VPLWQVFCPKGAYTAEDKQGLAERITGLFTSAPMPAFYVVVVFIEMSPDNYYVGAKPIKNFVRFKVDQMANTLPSQLAREWWMRHVHHAVAPYVSDRGYDSEVQIDEPGRDLWNINGMAPPPFGSIGEGKWIKENKVLPYTEDDKLPINSSYASRMAGDKTP